MQDFVSSVLFIHKFRAVAHYSITMTRCNDDDDFLKDPNKFSGQFEALSNTPAVKTVPRRDERSLYLNTADGWWWSPEGSRHSEKPQIQKHSWTGAERVG